MTMSKYYEWTDVGYFVVENVDDFPLFVRSSLHIILNNCLSQLVKASKVPFFGTRKRPIFVILGQKKLDFRRPNLKSDTTFCRQLSSKMME